MDIKQFNAFLQRQVCPQVLYQLSDQNLLPLFLESISMKRKKQKLQEIMSPIQETALRESILQQCMLEMIPPGTKGVIRGNKFNSLVKDRIKNLNLDGKRFRVAFEKNDLDLKFEEIPDWYIVDKSTNRVLVGMNQLDLWTGGQQINRASKYIKTSMDLPSSYKLVCVVCNPIQVASEKSKITQLLHQGFSGNVLCFVKYLPFYILSHFGLSGTRTADEYFTWEQEKK